MDTEALIQIGLTDLQSRIYLHLIEYGQRTPTEIAESLNENRTTVYSATEKLARLGIITQKDKGKITAFAPAHPSSLEVLAEKRLRLAARQSKNLEANLPSLINFYNEHQNQPGVATFYGQEGINTIRNKTLTTGQPLLFIRSPHDDKQNPDLLQKFIADRVKAGITSESIAPSEFTKTSDQAQLDAWLLKRTLLPKNEYNSPVEIDIFGDNVAFLDFENNAMSTIIESKNIADAMRQLFRVAQKYVAKSADQAALLAGVEPSQPPSPESNPPSP